MLDEIRAARASVNMECYIFRADSTGRQFMEALAERARAGVAVTLVVDAVGSVGFGLGAIRELRSAGCRVELYQRIRWYRLARLNNRTHRELLIVDGRVAFVGGAGVADSWGTGRPGHRPWRDTMARVQGPVVAAVQGVFAENWLECCGEILVGDLYFPALEPCGETLALVVKSSPADRATVSRVVFQLLLEGTRETVRINTPYFLPDRSLRKTFVELARRGVKVDLILPGASTDQRWVRLASRRKYGQLLEAGIRIHEYRPGMIHVKAMIVDGVWAVIGTTNIDNRSFEHNDENWLCRTAARARLTEDFSGISEAGRSRSPRGKTSILEAHRRLPGSWAAAESNSAQAVDCGTSSPARSGGARLPSLRSAAYSQTIVQPSRQLPL